MPGGGGGGEKRTHNRGGSEQHRGVPFHGVNFVFFFVYLWCVCWCCGGVVWFLVEWL